MADLVEVSGVDESWSEWLRRYVGIQDPAAMRFSLAEMKNAFIDGRLSTLAVEGELRTALLDPSVVHVNMLRGGIAKPSARNIWHLYGDEALIEAMPQSARTALTDARSQTEGV